MRHQRHFRNGEIDPKYEWLDQIVKKLARSTEKPTDKLAPRAKSKAQYYDVTHCVLAPIEQ